MNNENTSLQSQMDAILNGVDLSEEIKIESHKTKSDSVKPTNYSFIPGATDTMIYMKVNGGITSIPFRKKISDGENSILETIVNNEKIQLKREGDKIYGAQRFKHQYQTQKIAILSQNPQINSIAVKADSNMSPNFNMEQFQQALQNYGLRQDYIIIYKK